MHPACESSLSSYDLSLSPGRTAAFDVLRRVQGGAYASDLLAAKTESLPARDAARHPGQGVIKRPDSAAMYGS